jgi:hypothetical protein
VVWIFCVLLMFSSPNACSITARVSVGLLPRFALNVMFFCQIHIEIAWGQIHNSKQKDIKISTSTQLREILYTDS